MNRRGDQTALPDSAQAIVATALAQHPQLTSVTAAGFWEFLIRTIPVEQDVAALSADLLGDKLLSYAALEQQSLAIDILQKEILEPQARLVASRFRQGSDFAAELCQRVLIKLVVGTSTRPAKLAGHRATARLRSYCSKILYREALRLWVEQYRSQRTTLFHEAVEAQLLSDLSVVDAIEAPVLAALRQKHGTLLKEAFREVLRDLKSPGQATESEHKQLLRKQAVHMLVFMVLSPDSTAELASSLDLTVEVVRKRIQKLRSDLAASLICKLQDRGIPYAEARSLVRSPLADELTFGALL